MACSSRKSETEEHWKERRKETKIKAEGKQKGISRRLMIPMHRQVSACG